ncbi:2-methylcitrate dehydratase (plasmid) [Neorhizobium sp. SOG26]|uniref:MmgE/PrpD family protein n=1 Tax=Neorhizobium sp. SOG26 TaxID=2060726 RepID=UPI000E569CCD|nr:MmgE/PrpD family protein [Neorhizobium sp. SOG26]AXV17871.1 2-methylcitrate dehydratase [Neorhizobium sp. SOG26]
MTAKTLTRVLADYVAGSSYEKLPANVVERTKLIILDEIACAILGRELIAGELIGRYVAAQGGNAEATILGARHRVPAAMAALANGTAGHADEFDGAHVTDGHPGAVIVHATLAVGEARRTTGREFIHAVSVGYDVGTRLVASLGGAFALRKAHHVHSDHLHSFGAAMACGRLLRLDSDGLRHAAALAGGHAGGLAVVFEERRHMSKALSTGQAAFGGATAALLAASGFEGHDDVFDSGHGPLGWAPAGGPEVLTKGLGTDHAVMGANFKFYSAGYPIHAPVEAALTINGREKLGLDDIASVTIRLTTHTADTVSNRDMPSICVEDMMSVAIVHGKLGFEEAHSAAALARPEVKAIRPKIRAVADPEMDRTQPNGRGAKVEIETVDGRSFLIGVDHPRGHALRGGVDWQSLRGKWDELLPRLIGASNFEAFTDICQNLERLDDLAELTHLLRT